MVNYIYILTHTHARKIIKINENISNTDKGKVYGWGNAEYGQLPVKEDSYQINIATELNTQELGHIIDIAAGGSYCMVLNSKYENL